MAVPFKVKAVYDYASEHDDDLKFSIGQIITVTDQEDADWYEGNYVDENGAMQEGIFPRNFVEKFEPMAPPRPTRTRTKKETDQSSAHVAIPTTEPAPALIAEPEDTAPVRPKSPTQAAPATEILPRRELRQQTHAETSVEQTQAAEPERVKTPPPATAKNTKALLPTPPRTSQDGNAAPDSAGNGPVAVAQAPTITPAAAAAPGTAKTGGGPPPVTTKPTSSSFKDRIAAFNKAAPPPMPKPGGLTTGNTANKPWMMRGAGVAPPPSRDAYVPQPARDVPITKPYRREEDPEIKERETENQQIAEKAGLASTSQEDEDQPKPLSLKERMALLQKQQQEQQQRAADAAAKKEKPKRPAKKRMESYDTVGEGDIAAPELRDTVETGGRRSLEDTHPPRISHPPRRRSSKGPSETQDGNEADMSGAGDTTEGQESEVTEKEDSDDKTKRISRAPTGQSTAHSIPPVQEEAGEDEEEEEDEGDDEEEEVDPEVRRKEELRARMAKMSGGMGMMGMGLFGQPGMMPGASSAAPKEKKKKPAPIEKRPSEPQEDLPLGSPTGAAPPVPGMMALPGMSARRSEDASARQEEPLEFEEDDDLEESVEEEPTPVTRAPTIPSRTAAGPPPIPGDRPAPPPVPAESRPPPPLPHPVSDIKSPSEGSESDDELSEHTQEVETPKGEAPPATRAPPPPPPPAAAAAAAAPPPPTTPRSPNARRTSYMGEDVMGQSPPATVPSKRNSRPPPPIPGVAPAPQAAQTRPPPPPPPPGSLSRQSTADRRPMSPTTFAREDEEGEEEEEVTEYEGDYDTDIASSVPHKDALKSHARDSSIEEQTPQKSPSAEEAPPRLPPPVPSARAPPPIPTHAPPSETRRSSEMPRNAPPPPPPVAKETPRVDEEYDPFNYSAVPQGVGIPGMSSPPSRARKTSSDETYAPPDLSLSYPGVPQGRVPPPPPNTGRSNRQSLDVGRAPTGRRSMDAHRPSTESGFVANDIDLAPQSGWWTNKQSLPPQLQGRKDIFFESEESQTSEGGGKTKITRDLWVLYQDYSQTVITVQYDASNPSDVNFEQRHEPPPRSLRQDQLEQSYERFGRSIADAVPSKKDSVVGDGTPQGLIHELLRPLKDALLPVGTRAYGALVYSNLANASTSQNDEIRAGDIISIRNAKFQGKHGPMHAKYTTEVGKPDHVAVVSEWDGTKKKVRAWEQGRESKKVKLESFKLDDLRSGEVKIWRVMPRSWVGWEGQN